MSKAKTPSEDPQSVPASLKNHQLDGIDYAILNMLQANNDRNHAEISRLLARDGIHIKGPAVGNRVDALMSNGYIRRNVSIVDYKKLNVAQIYIFLVLMTDKTGANKDEFFDAANVEPDILEIYDMIGGADFMLKVAVADLEEATEIQKRLQRIGAEIQLLSVSKTLKYTTAIRVPRATR